MAHTNLEDLRRAESACRSSAGLPRFTRATECDGGRPGRSGACRGANWRHFEDGGIVDQDIDAAEFHVDGFDDGIDRGDIRYDELHRLGGRVDYGGGLDGTLDVNIRDYDLCAFLDECFGKSQTNAARAACDQRNPIFQSHVELQFDRYRGPELREQNLAAAACRAIRRSLWFNAKLPVAYAAGTPCSRIIAAPVANPFENE
jgi:hypothetical protein